MMYKLYTKEGIAHLRQITQNGSIAVAQLHTDFILQQRGKNITEQSIIHPESHKVIGRMRSFTKDKLLAVYRGRKELAAFNTGLVYTERKREIDYSILTVDEAQEDQTIQHLEGLWGGFTFAPRSVLEKLYVYPAGDEVTTIFETRNESLEAALTGALMSFAQRVEAQELVYELFR